MSITTLIQANPRISIIIIALLVSFLSTLATKLLTNQERLKELKEEQKKSKELLKQHKGNTEKMMEIQKGMMSGSMEMMKQSFKPMIITLIPLLIVFSFLRSTYAATELAKSWIWYYLAAAIIGSMLFKKILKVH
ncbi:DUF106 domain-containing protein [Candidatus Pacearchaeota archaeon]|nr:DUF106 domain-containing protein [Candidatus Pacearchaeota archaeon]